MSEAATIKFPRVVVSEARHKKLSAEAKKRKVPIAVVAEELFVADEKAKRASKK